MKYEVFVPPAISEDNSKTVALLESIKYTHCTTLLMIYVIWGLVLRCLGAYAYNSIKISKKVTISKKNLRTFFVSEKHIKK